MTRAATLAMFLALAVTAGARIHRSPAARRAFVRAHPCPATGKRRGACPGYVVDHVIPLACGGPDAPANMQWQTVAAARAKDKVERLGCVAKVVAR